MRDEFRPSIGGRRRRRRAQVGGDLREPRGGGGLRAVREIRELSPETSMVALSGYDDRNTVIDMLDAGAVAYIVKGASREEILTTMRRAIEAHEKLSQLGV
jgi:DNA-binding NarL/FixJ family response regulator